MDSRKKRTKLTRLPKKQEDALTFLEKQAKQRQKAENSNLNNQPILPQQTDTQQNNKKEEEIAENTKAIRKTNGELNHRQKLFVSEYLKDMNGRRAYIAAGYKGRDNVADSAACQLLNNIKVQEAIAKGFDRIIKSNELTAERVLRELSNIGFSNVLDFCKWDSEGNVTLKTSEEIGEEDGTGTAPIGRGRRDLAAAVSKLSLSKAKDGSKHLDLTFHKKVKALELLGKYFSLFRDKVDVDIKGGLLVIPTTQEKAQEWLDKASKWNQEQLKSAGKRDITMKQGGRRLPEVT
jgi:hypothetical protein